MRTEPRVRGRGVAPRLLAHVLADARARGVTRVSLETGSMAFFEPARASLRLAGFVPCGPFGDYVEDPNSTFMTMARPAELVGVVRRQGDGHGRALAELRGELDVARVPLHDAVDDRQAQAGAGPGERVGVRRAEELAEQLALVGAR